MTAIYRSMTSRGLQPGYALTVGNEAGLNAADYIEYFTQDEDTKVIACFIEAIREPERFRAACLAARAAGKPVVAIKIGGSEASRNAALAHTGSLAGSLQCFDAVAEAIGVIRVDTIDEMTEVVEVLTHGKLPDGARVGAITFSGGLKGLLLEAAERNRVEFPPLQAATLEKLREVLGIGTSLGNPLDAGFAALSSKEAYFRCIEIMQEDPGLDLIVVQEELPTAEGVNDKAANLRVVNEMAAAPGAKPVAVVSMASYMYTDYTRSFREGFLGLPVLHEVDKALKALRRVGDWNEAARRASAAPHARPATPPAGAAAILARATPAPGGLRVLGEADSKALLAAYGVAAPKEAFARDADSAAAAARSIGFPVVLKLVSPDVQHKTEVGGVLVGVADEAGVREGFAQIRAALAAKEPHAKFEGVLVAQQVGRGVELVVGVQRDPEVGPVVMFGSGGIMLEVAKDVAFGAVPMSPEEARRLIERTGASRLAGGLPRRAAVRCRGGRRRDLGCLAPGGRLCGRDRERRRQPARRRAGRARRAGAGRARHPARQVHQQREPDPMTETIRVEQEQRAVATIVLDRPDRGNAFNQQMLDELYGALKGLSLNKSVRAIVLRGAGKHFCTGADIGGRGESSGGVSLGQMLEALDTCPKPTIALVQGGCVGGGLAIAACCDVLMAQDGAFFSVPELRVGIAPSRELSVYFMRAIGARAFRRYGLSGERIGAAGRPASGARARSGRACGDRGAARQTDRRFPALRARSLGRTQAPHRPHRLRRAGARRRRGAARPRAFSRSARRRRGLSREAQARLVSAGVTVRGRPHERPSKRRRVCSRTSTGVL